MAGNLGVGKKEIAVEQPGAMPTRAKHEMAFAQETVLPETGQEGDEQRTSSGIGASGSGA